MLSRIPLSASQKLVILHIKQFQDFIFNFSKTLTCSDYLNHQPTSIMPGIIVQVKQFQLVMFTFPVFYLFLVRYGKYSRPIQSGREISSIILTVDYVCYKEPKRPYNVFSFNI